MNIPINKFTRYNFLKCGWDALHYAILSRKPLERMPYFIDADSEPEDCGFQQELNAEFKRYWPLYSQLAFPIMQSTGSWQIDPEDAEIAREQIWSVLQQAVSARSKELYGKVAKVQSVSGFITSINDYARDAQVDMLKGIKFSAPATVARNAWKSMDLAAKVDPLVNIDIIAWGVALIGWVAVAFDHLTPCKFCFRWAAPGRSHCYLHCQSKHSPGTASERFMRYRAGRATSLKFVQSYYRGDIEFRLSNSNAVRSRILWDLIFATPITEHQIGPIRASLLKSPRVLELLGGSAILDLPPEQLIPLLQEKIDGLEVSPEAFFLKINMFDRWIAIEREVAPGKRPPDRYTSKKIQDAIKLAKAGTSCVAIAKELQVTRSAVANWKSRYPQFAEAFPVKVRN